ncbi:dickkopf-related protein 4-like [Hypomesus transpacificus]|uniref:dickkopf-related protein 4-like n=1 Tax=Hypomesus transpacificus TaxID=137520 RepID=UPI001F07C294|nr:dickkopf-related protein 4-like [Hypomesus transpacificus]
MMYSYSHGLAYMISFMSFSYRQPISKDSNVIRSSKEVTDPVDQQRSQSGSDSEVHNSGNARRRVDTSSNRHSSRSALERETCRNKSKRNRTSIRHPTSPENKEKVPERGPCVRSGDCGEGLCCVRDGRGKSCQRIPVEGEACLLRGRSKVRRRNLERCDCGHGLACRGNENSRGLGVCRPKQRREARHSKRLAERKCG